MIEKDDWRLTGQERYLMNKKLYFVPEYKPYCEEWEHEHCVFCMATIACYEGCLHEGYCTTDVKQSNWICKSCFEDFKEMFRLKVIGNIPEGNEGTKNHRVIKFRGKDGSIIVGKG
jgi:hypothetical protein